MENKKIGLREALLIFICTTIVPCICIFTSTRMIEIIKGAHIEEQIIPETVAKAAQVPLPEPATPQEAKHKEPVLHQEVPPGKKYPIIVDKSWTREEIRQIIKKSKHSNILYPLAECESGFEVVAKIDSNGLYSRGILQYQKATWEMWEASSGYKGDPMNPYDAISIAEWAIDNHLLGHWSCAHILGFVK
jgi:hypothetical protein